MNNHIINKSPFKLYYRDNNYNYTFLNSFEEYYDTQYYYNLLNYTDLKNILYTIYLNWYTFKKINNISKNNIIYFQYNCEPEDFNSILKLFINNEYSISIFCINNIIKYYL
jgi:hypothetical protein